jgi:hypothetical protein
MKRLFGSLCVVILLTGCATADIIPIGSNTYMISQTSAGGVFKAMGSLKASVIKRANAFAESKGKLRFLSQRKRHRVHRAECLIMSINSFWWIRMIQEHLTLS